jgi:hypothetical protein
MDCDETALQRLMEPFGFGGRVGAGEQMRGATKRRKVGGKNLHVMVI